MKNIVTLFTLLAALAFNSSCSNNKEKTHATQKQEPTLLNTPNDLPPLLLTGMNGYRSMANELKGKTILVLYQPDCEDCQREAVEIQENLDAFKDYSLHFVSNASLEQQAEFAKAYKLEGHENIHFAQTSIENIINALGPIPTPSLYIFSEEGQLVKDFKGETDIQQILRHL